MDKFIEIIEPTTIEIKADQSAIVLNSDGTLEAAYFPQSNQEEADEGMMMIAQILFTAKDPDLRKMIEEKFFEKIG